MNHRLFCSCCESLVLNLAGCGIKLEAEGTQSILTFDGLSPEGEQVSRAVHQYLESEGVAGTLDDLSVETKP